MPLLLNFVVHCVTLHCHQRVTSLTSFLSRAAAPCRRRVLRVYLAIHASRSSKLVICEFLLHQAASVLAGVPVLSTVRPPTGAAPAIAPSCWRLAKPSQVELPVFTAVNAPPRLVAATRPHVRELPCAPVSSLARRCTARRRLRL
ncbi:hypothetical protein Scep_024079 [Stephania cephalantha]|uniref:Uncharacterized protein n=1 Tax=Stephania cephalantha TaxID=152367 RepID=A0AAP0HY22_9MAGN